MRRTVALLLITLLAIVPAMNALAQGSPVATPGASPVAASDTEISFESGPDTLYGSYMVPAGLSGPAPAVLIISGSGPTDRNGDSPGLPAGTNRHFAEDLAGLGVASFRYDKIGSGKTGLGTHGLGEGVDYDLFLQEAWDAFDVLAAQPEIDPERIVVLGHSEGALFALDMVTNETRANRPAGIILAAPISGRYLDIVREQFAGAYADLVTAGQLTNEAETTLVRELDDAISEIRETGDLTMRLTDPGVGMLFGPVNIDFLYQADQRDPQELASDVPDGMPVLIIHGAKDEQVTAADVDGLASAFEEIGHEAVMRVEIADANHIFQAVEGAPSYQRDYMDRSLPFSPEVGEALRVYMQPLLPE